MSTADPERELVELNREECLSLLRGEFVGRIASSVAGGAPIVVPVNFVMDGDDPVYRTRHADSIPHLLGSPVSFQVDRLDPSHRTGWSVLVHGVAELASDSDAGLLHVVPWAPGERSVFIRVAAKAITGRRIELHLESLDGRGYL